MIERIDNANSIDTGGGVERKRSVINCKMPRIPAGHLRAGAWPARLLSTMAVCILIHLAPRKEVAYSLCLDFDAFRISNGLEFREEFEVTLLPVIPRLQTTMKPLVQ